MTSAPISNSIRIYTQSPESLSLCNYKFVRSFQSNLIKWFAYIFILNNLDTLNALCVISTDQWPIFIPCVFKLYRQENPLECKWHVWLILYFSIKFAITVLYNLQRCAEFLLNEIIFIATLNIVRCFHLLKCKNLLVSIRPAPY